MKYAIFSDIHGNSLTLKHMLQDLSNESVDGYIYCGDIAGYYYDQEEVVKIFKNLKKLFIVKGNHDKYYEDINHESSKIFYMKKYGNSYKGHMNKEVESFINSLPLTLSIEINNLKVGIFHGSPDDPLNGRIYPDCKSFTETFGLYDICFLGHTHYQLNKKINNTLIINPGSLGQPRDGKGFSYCIFDFDTLNPDFRTVGFNSEELKKRVNLMECEENIKYYLTNVLDRGMNNE